MSLRTMPLRVGVLGCGRIASSIHLPILAGMREVAVAAIADPDGARRHEALRLVPGARSDADFRESLANGHLDALPDLFVEWAEADHFMTRVVHPRGELRQSPCEFHRDSDHSREGFVAAAGPLILGRGDLGELSPLALAPTFLHLLGADRSRRGQPHPAIIGRKIESFTAGPKAL